MRTVQEARTLYPDFDQRLRLVYAKLREMGREQLEIERRAAPPQPVKKAA